MSKLTRCVGNLSQERVSKRDVFELFYRYGRLAQISLKSAYGFVQYHTVVDAQAAMDALQGAEVKGRKISKPRYFPSSCDKANNPRPRGVKDPEVKEGPRSLS